MSMEPDLAAFHFPERFRSGKAHVPDRFADDLPDRLQEGIPEIRRA
jgi:hypothetical protein